MGYPIWVETAAPPIRTFLTSCDLSGKTVVLFCASGTSSAETIGLSVRRTAPPAEPLRRIADHEQRECAFIGRGSYSCLHAEPDSGEPCRMSFFSLTRQFLCEFYQTLDAACRKMSAEPLLALHPLPHRPEIESFFLAASLCSER